MPAGNQRLENSLAIVVYYEAAIETIEKGNNSAPPAKQPQNKWYQHLLSQPPTWSVLHHKDKNPTHELVNSITEESLKQLVIDGAKDSAIADSGASSSCAKEPVSECGRYRLAADPLVDTVHASNIIFQYG